MHKELCLEVEAVQLEQMALLRCLIKDHGLKRIYGQGMTEKDMPNYQERIGGLRSAGLRGKNYFAHGTVSAWTPDPGSRSLR